MANVRNLEKADLPALVALYHSVFSGASATPDRILAQRFERMYFQSPWQDPAIRSLGYWKGDELLGFLGVFPRALRHCGQPIRMAVTNNFMVRPGNAAPLAAAVLLRQHFLGPQDLSLAQAPAAIRRFWCSLGGLAVPAYSLQWTRPLRFGSFAANQVSHRSPLLGACSRPAAVVADWLTSRHTLASYDDTLRRSVSQPCDVPEHLNLLRQLAPGYDLFPDYSPASLEWMWSVLEEQANWRGPLTRRIVTDANRKPLGCFAYHGESGQTGEVLHCAALPMQGRLVFGQMLNDARQRGLAGLTGAMNTHGLDMLDDPACFLRRHGAWMLIHTKRPEIANAFFQGKAFISRLEDEWMFFKVAA
jgi:hypothetical protein